MTTRLPPVWLELTLDCVGDDVRVSARGSRGENHLPRTLAVQRAALLQFASAVEHAARHGQPLPDSVVAQAQAFQKAVLSDDVGKLFSSLQSSSDEPLFLRLLVHQDLRAVPWEALCNPGESLGFWGTSSRVLPVRGVTTSEPWRPREIRGAVKVLAIAPTDAASLVNLKQALQTRIDTGEIEWLDPVQGLAAKVPAIFARLRREPVPNVIHFLGHGGIDSRGRPCLRMSDEDDEEKWLPVEVLAQQIAASFRGMLRLVVLEACETAASSTSALISPGFSSAAQILTQAGADAVVAFSWPTRAKAALTCTTEFYRALTGIGRSVADVAFALNEARRAMIGAYDGSAEALNPVAYVRGPEGRVFDFKNRKVEAPKPSVTISAEAGQVPSGLARILRVPFSLVLGDRWKQDRKALDKFRDKLHQELTKVSHAPNGLPMSTLAQWFALHRGSDKLGNEFQKAFRASMQGPPVFSAVARLLPPGVHTTLLRNPWLEQGLAEHHPERTIYVIQPQDGGALVLKREAGVEEWEELDKAPAEVNLDEEFLVLRPYRGYTPDEVFTPPLLTEDDYYLGLRELWKTKVLPEDLGNALRRTLEYRPTLILGLSMLTANHRMLLHTLYERGLQRTSLAVIEPDDREGAMWGSGTGLPGKGAGIEVLETSIGDLEAAFAAMAEKAGP